MIFKWLWANQVIKVRLRDSFEVRRELYGRRDLKGKYTQTKQETVWWSIPSHCGGNCHTWVSMKPLGAESLLNWVHFVMGKSCFFLVFCLPQDLRPRLHGSGQIFARTKTCTVPPCVHTGPTELDEFFNGKVCKFGTWKKQVNVLTGTVPISYELV